MSTILKALRRLEAEKTRLAGRPLREQVASGPEPVRRFPVVLVAVAVFAVGLGMGAGALFLWPGSFRDEAVREPASETIARVLPEAPVRRAPAVVAAAPPPEAAGPEPAPFDPDAAAAVEPEPSGIAAEPEPSGIAAAPPEAEPEPEAAAVAEPQGPVEEVPEVELVRRIEPPPLVIREEVTEEPRPPRPGEIRPGAEALKPRSAQTASVARAEPRPPPPPPAEDVEPAPRRSEVPVILVSRTRWHPAAERREALIEVGSADVAEPRRVREGEMVGPLLVQRIEPSGVIFLYEGVQLRHAVGSAD